MLRENNFCDENEEDYPSDVNSNIDDEIDDHVSCADQDISSKLEYALERHEDAEKSGISLNQSDISTIERLIAVVEKHNLAIPDHVKELVDSFLSYEQ